MSPEERLKSVSNEALVAEAARRGKKLLNAIGTAATEGFELDPASPEQRFEVDLRHFIEPEVNPEVEFSVNEQLVFGRKFLDKIGQKFSITSVNKNQRDEINEALRANQFHRVMPTILSSAEALLDDRLASVKLAQQLQPEKSPVRPKELAIYPKLSVYDQLLASPDGQVAVTGSKNAFGNGETIYVLRYKSPLDPRFLVNRTTYLEELAITGQAIQAGPGKHLTLPQLDIRAVVETKKVTDPQAIFDSIDPICSPELLINLFLLHQLNGRPLGERYIYANEAVFRLDQATNTESLEYFPACVFGRPFDHQIGLGLWGATDISPDDRRIKGALSKVAL